MIVCPFYLEWYRRGMLSRRWRTTASSCGRHHPRKPTYPHKDDHRPGLSRSDVAARPHTPSARLLQQVDNNSYIRRRRGLPTTGTRQQKPLHRAWEWELRATCQTSVRYAALGDSMVGGVREAILLTAQNQELLTLGDGRLLSSKDSCCTSPETFFRLKRE